MGLQRFQVNRERLPGKRGKSRSMRSVKKQTSRYRRRHRLPRWASTEDTGPADFHIDHCPPPRRGYFGHLL